MIYNERLLDFLKDIIENIKHENIPAGIRRSIQELHDYCRVAVKSNEFEVDEFNTIFDIFKAGLIQLVTDGFLFNLYLSAGQREAYIKKFERCRKAITRCRILCLGYNRVIMGKIQHSKFLRSYNIVYVAVSNATKRQQDPRIKAKFENIGGGQNYHYMAINIISNVYAFVPAFDLKLNRNTYDSCTIGSIFECLNYDSNKNYVPIIKQAALFTWTGYIWKFFDGGILILNQDYVDFSDPVLSYEEEIKGRPILGIFKKFPHEKKPNLNAPMWYTVRTMTRIARSFGYDIGLFGIEDVHGDIVTATFFDVPSKGLWRRMNTRIPKVVYDLHLRKSKLPDGLSPDNIERFMDGVIGVNDPRFKRIVDDKLLTYTFLYGFSRENKFRLLHTISLHADGQQVDEEGIRDLLEKGCVFIKLRRGEGGKGVIKLERPQDGMYRTTDIGEVKTYKTIKDLFKSKTFKKIVNNPQLYIAQEGVDTLTYKGKAFDLRILLNRGCNGQISSLVPICRVGAEGSPLSNQSQGGKAYEPQNIIAVALSDLYGKNITQTYDIQEAARIIETAMKLALEVISFLEMQLSHIGEASVDFLIDKQGNLYLCEINARPGKSDILDQVGSYKGTKFQSQLDIPDSPVYQYFYNIVGYMIYLYQHSN